MGKRRRKHFLKTKLARDSAIIAIESALDALYRGEIAQDRRLYYGAGLLYYLGYEKYSRHLDPGEPFLYRLKPWMGEKHNIHGIYQRGREEAQKYLSREVVADLIQQATQAVVEHENQRALSRALLTELLRK